MSPSGNIELIDDQSIRDTETANKYLSTGVEAEQRGDRLKAIEAYEAAYTADPENPEVCFRLAYSLDLVGEEDEAVHLYEQCVQQTRPPLNALMNLAVLYEDRGRYAQAEKCVRQVLITDPTHARAQLFLKDIIASKNMVIDDRHLQQIEQHSAMLETPVTDFELSLRTRNSLRKMSIRTLGDLLRITETELCSYKNMGEASLEEVKTMLAQRGLRLGQTAEQQKSAIKQAVYDQIRNNPDSNEEVLSRSVNELALSVRSRKALSLLGIQTIGDLCMRTEAELMGVKNFGSTSLVEITEKLTEKGLSLRALEQEPL